VSSSDMHMHKRGAMTGPRASPRDKLLTAYCLVLLLQVPARSRVDRAASARSRVQRLALVNPVRVHVDGRTQICAGATSRQQSQQQRALEDAFDPHGTRRRSARTVDGRLERLGAHAARQVTDVALAVPTSSTRDASVLNGRWSNAVPASQSLDAGGWRWLQGERRTFCTRRPRRASRRDT